MADVRSIFQPVPLKEGKEEKELIILPLGVIFVPNDALAIQALSKILGEDASKKAGLFLQTAGPYIAKLKMGQMTVKKFNEEMVQAVKTVYGREISIEQFNEIWAARYMPEIPKNLSAVLNESKKKEIIFYSFTNQKDEQIIVNICREKKIEVQLDQDGHLERICDIRLHASHTAGVDKATLFKSIVSSQYKPNKKITLILGASAAQQIPELKEQLEKDNAAVEKAAGSVKILVNLVEFNPKDNLDFTKLLESVTSATFSVSANL